MHPKRGYEVDKGTGLRQLHKITKKGGTMCNKFNIYIICGKFKERICAYVRPQICYIPKEEAYSTIASLVDIFASFVIGTHEVRDMAVFDVPGKYLNADMSKEKIIILKLRVDL